MSSVGKCVKRQLESASEDFEEESEQYPLKDDLEFYRRVARVEPKEEPNREPNETVDLIKVELENDYQELIKSLTESDELNIQQLLNYLMTLLDIDFCQNYNTNKRVELRMQQMFQHSHQKDFWIHFIDAAIKEIGRQYKPPAQGDARNRISFHQASEGEGIFELFDKRPIASNPRKKRLYAAAPPEPSHFSFDEGSQDTISHFETFSNTNQSPVKAKLDISKAQASNSARNPHLEHIASYMVYFLQFCIQYPNYLPIKQLFWTINNYQYAQLTPNQMATLRMLILVFSSVYCTDEMKAYYNTNGQYLISTMFKSDFNVDFHFRGEYFSLLCLQKLFAIDVKPSLIEKYDPKIKDKLLKIIDDDGISFGYDYHRDLVERCEQKLTNKNDILDGDRSWAATKILALRLLRTFDGLWLAKDVKVTEIKVNKNRKMPNAMKSFEKSLYYGKWLEGISNTYSNYVSSISIQEMADPSNSESESERVVYLDIGLLTKGAGFYGVISQVGLDQLESGYEGMMAFPDNIGVLDDSMSLNYYGMEFQKNLETPYPVKDCNYQIGSVKTLRIKVTLNQREKTKSEVEFFLDDVLVKPDIPADSVEKKLIFDASKEVYFAMSITAGEQSVLVESDKFELPPFKRIDTL